MATAKQLAWRKKFAAMAKAGTLKKGARKKNPTKMGKSKIHTSYRGKYPHVIREVSIQKGIALVTTYNGDQWQISAAETGGKSPQLGDSVIDGVWVPKIKRKKNPTARGITLKNASKKPSQATGRKPAARLVARRKATVKGPAGYFANPAKQNFPFTVNREKSDGEWLMIAKCSTQKDALEIAHLLADKTFKQHAVTTSL